MNKEQLSALAEQGMRDLATTRRKAVDDAIDRMVYDAQRSANDGWAMVDRLRQELSISENQHQATQRALTEMTRRWMDAEALLAASKSVDGSMTPRHGDDQGETKP